MSCHTIALASLIRSWTVWFNGAVVPTLFMLEQQFSVFEGLLGPKWYQPALAAIVIINVALRAKTAYAAAQAQLGGE